MAVYSNIVLVPQGNILFNASYSSTQLIKSSTQTLYGVFPKVVFPRRVSTRVHHAKPSEHGDTIHRILPRIPELGPAGMTFGTCGRGSNACEAPSQAFRCSTRACCAPTNEDILLLLRLDRRTNSITISDRPSSSFSPSVQFHLHTAHHVSRCTWTTVLGRRPNGLWDAGFQHFASCFGSRRGQEAWCYWSWTDGMYQLNQFFLSINLGL